MVICICNAINETCLRRCARSHPGNAEALYARLGRPPQCRQCLEEAEHIVAEERASSLCAA